jgi:hypothetical protein
VGARHVFLGGMTFLSLCRVKLLDSGEPKEYDGAVRWVV